MMTDKEINDELQHLRRYHNELAATALRLSRTRFQLEKVPKFKESVEELLMLELEARRHADRLLDHQVEAESWREVLERRTKDRRLSRLTEMLEEATAEDFHGSGPMLRSVARTIESEITSNIWHGFEPPPGSNWFVATTLFANVLQQRLSD